MTDSVLKDTVNALADKLVVTDLRQPGKVKFPLVPALFAIITAWCSGCNNAVAVADYLCSKREDPCGGDRRSSGKSHHVP